MIRLLCFALIGLSLSGCSLTKPRETVLAQEPPIRRPEFLVPFGMARIDGQRDVVVTPENIEHVLYPR